MWSIRTVSRVLLAILCAFSLARAEDVQVYRDFYGVPHIFATSDEGAFFGNGYAQAEDHLTGMLRQISMFLGRAYYANGGSNLEDIFQDAFLNAFEVNKQARRRYPELSPETRSFLEAFCAGVNQYMREHPAEVPAFWQGEVEGWHMLAYLKGFTLGSQVPAILAKTPAGVLPIRRWMLSGEPQSNQWALAPGRVSTGNACVQMDPHLTLALPYLWYETHMKGATFESAGATLFGGPIVVMGHSMRCAWSMTDNEVDNADVLKLALDRTNRRRYVFDGQSHPFDFQASLLTTPGGDLDFRYAKTPWGPVLNKVNPLVPADPDFSDLNFIYVAQATMANQIHQFDQLLAMNRARNVREFKAAMSMLQIEKWNFVFADTQGTIAYVHNSRHPDRNVDFNTVVTLPFDGTDPSKVWEDDDIIPFEDLLQMTNPPKGFLANCNHAPWNTNPHYGYNERSFPRHMIGIPEMNTRGPRALALIDTNATFTPEELRAISVDTLIPHADDVISLMRPNYDAYKDGLSAADQNFALRMITVLERWDRTCNRESTGMLAWSRYYSNSRNNLSEFPFRHTRGEVLDRNLGVQFLKDLAAGAKNTLNLYGTLEKPWKEVRGIQRGTDYFGCSGYLSSMTLRVKQGTLENSTGRVLTNFGSSYTQFCELSTPPKAWSMLPFGQNENPASPHFSDLTALYSQDHYKPMFHTVAEITDHNYTMSTLEWPPVIVPTPTPTITPTPTPTPPPMPMLTTELAASFTGRELDVTMRLTNGGPGDVPVSLWVLVEIQGVFYFYPRFDGYAIPLAEFDMPAIDSGWFSLFELSVPNPIGANVTLNWYAAMLRQGTGELLGEVASAAVTID